MTQAPIEYENLATSELSQVGEEISNAIGTLDAWLETDDGCECDICNHLRRARQAAAIAASEVDSALAMHRECDAEYDPANE